MKLTAASRLSPTSVSSDQVRPSPNRLHSTFPRKRPKTQPESKIIGRAMCTVNHGMRSPAKV